MLGLCFQKLLSRMEGTNMLLSFRVCLAKNKTIQCSGLLVLKLVKVMM
jgi:hypothetical protein